MDFKEVLKLSKDLKVLYAEDEQATREHFLNIFKNYFNEVVAVENGEEAFNEYKNKNFDIVITDVTMPKMGGLELIEKIKEINPNQKCIIVSAHNSPDFFQKAIELNVDGYILKPVNFKQLNEIIYKISNQIKNEKKIKEYQSNLEKELQKKTKELKKAYLFDKLTSLPNRNALNDVLALYENKCEGILIDIDNFESINLVYGYEIGDMLIKEFAEFLSKNITDEMKLFYIGGDEFVILSQRDDIINFSKDLQKKINKTFFTSKKIPITVSISVTKKRPLLINLNIALKESKQKGYNRIEIYSDDSKIELFQKKVRKYLPLIEKALESDKIVPFFQPIVDNETLKVKKYEVLARLVDENEIYPAFEFIEVATKSGLIPLITKEIIKKSFKIASEANINISINLSDQDLRDDEFIEFLEKERVDNNLKPSNVTIEVLENLKNLEEKRFIDILNTLKKLGYVLAIDDFGTYNSNFERLYDIDVDILKIDGKFVKNIDKNEKDRKLLKSMLEFAKVLNVKTVCEFVSTKEIFEISKKLGSLCSQGYFFSAPKSAEKIVGGGGR